MVIYFCGSISGKNFYLENYKKIIASLEKLGHTVTQYNLFTTTVEDVQKQTKEEKIKVHKMLDKLKLESDLVVAELSNKSFGQGQEIAHAFRVGKPVLGLYVKGKKPHLVLSDAGDRLILSAYNLENLQRVLKEGLDYLEVNEYKRFTMNLPSQIINYLDKISRDKDISRSEYIRNLISEDMKKQK